MYANRLGMVDAVGVATPGTKFMGGNAVDRNYLSGVDYPDDARPIAIPSYLWGGTGGRPVYLFAPGEVVRPDLYRYDLDGIMGYGAPGDVFTAPNNPKGAEVAMIVPLDSQSSGTLNPIVGAGDTATAARAGRPLVVLGWLALAALLLH